MPTQVAVSYSLTGNFDPGRVTRLLDFEPTRTWRAGDPVGNRGITRKDNGWVVEIQKAETLDVAEPLGKLLEMLKPRLTELYLETAKQGLVAILTCAVYVDAKDGAAPAMHFPRETIAQLHEMGASLDVDLYVL